MFINGLVHLRRYFFHIFQNRLFNENFVLKKKTVDDSIDNCSVINYSQQILLLTPGKMELPEPELLKIFISKASDL